MKKKYILMGVAAALIATTIIGGSLAAFQADGNVQQNINTRSLSIALSEDDKAVRGEFSPETAMPGSDMEKSITIENTADTPLYARVTIRKYWASRSEEGDGLNKEYGMGADKIVLDINGDEWYEDTAAKDEETSVYYYRMPLEAGASVEMLESLKIDENLDNSYTDKGIGLDVEVDAIQAMGAQNAMLSEWGVWADISKDGYITAIEE